MSLSPVNYSCFSQFISITTNMGYIDPRKHKKNTYIVENDINSIEHECQAD